VSWRPGRLRRRRRGPAGRGLPAADALPLRRARPAARIHDTEAFGPVATVMGYTGLDHAAALANRGGGSLVVSLVTADPSCRPNRHDGKRGLSRAHLHQQPHLDGREHRPRLPPAAHGPWRAGARGRRRGTGRRAGGPALHATDRPAGQPGHAERDHGPVAEGRRPARGAGASVHPRFEDLPSATRSRPSRARSRWRISSISRPSPATRSTPTWTRPRPAEPVLPGPRGPWLPDPQLRGGALRAARRGAGSGQYRVSKTCAFSSPCRPARRSACS
jgi:hypothetical protein